MSVSGVQPVYIPYRTVKVAPPATPAADDVDIDTGRDTGKGQQGPGDTRSTATATSNSGTGTGSGLSGAGKESAVDPGATGEVAPAGSEPSGGNREEVGDNDRDKEGGKEGEGGRSGGGGGGGGGDERSRSTSSVAALFRGERKHPARPNAVAVENFDLSDIITSHVQCVT